MAIFKNKNLQAVELLPRLPRAHAYGHYPIRIRKQRSDSDAGTPLFVLQRLSSEQTWISIVSTPNNAETSENLGRFTVLSYGRSDCILQKHCS